MTEIMHHLIIQWGVGLFGLSCLRMAVEIVHPEPYSVQAHADCIVARFWEGA